MKIDIQYTGCAEIYVHNNKLVTDSFAIAPKWDSFETRSSANISGSTSIFWNIFYLQIDSWIKKKKKILFIFNVKYLFNIKLSFETYELYNTVVREKK